MLSLAYLRRRYRSRGDKWQHSSPLAIVGLLISAAVTACLVVIEQAGWIEALVRDQQGTPVPGVWVCFEITLSPSGFPHTCKTTRTDGTAIETVEHGMRRVSLWVDSVGSDPHTLPEGYAFGEGALERTVEVMEDDTTRVEFVILKQAPQ